MPDSWTQRMDTIQTYEGDGSAQSRIYAWRTYTNCALDRPLVGAGFGADNPQVFARYAAVAPEYASFQGVVFVAHSIYFQMLGEHGFPGLGLFLVLWVVTWRTAGRLTRATKGDPEFGTWVPVLMPMVQVSLIGFAVGGAFLSLAYFDVPYYFVAFVALVDAVWKDHCKSVSSAGRQAVNTLVPTNPLAGNVASTTNVSMG
jgi:probable O-glycosylation ligase (exosortase A-associated)